jgi:phosphatidyl-myo-inositol alpha-mannosyltransferase
MRVLEVCPYDLERPGGVQRHVLDLGEALAEAGHDVVIVAPSDPSKSGQLRPGLRTVCVRGARVFRWHGTAFEMTRASAADLRSLLSMHDEAPFDVVHFHTLWTPWLPWQVFRLFAGQRVRFVATFHDTPPLTWSGQLARGVFRLLSRYFSSRLDAAIAVSEAPAQHLWLAKRCALHILPPCIDLRALRNLVTTSRQRSSERILFVGRLEPRKGVLLLIQAFALVRQLHPSAQLAICGDGEQADPAMALAQSLDLGEAVCLTGYVDQVERNRWLSDADVLCAPSPYGESYGLVLAEAMAAGLPVVAAANLGYRSVLSGEGATGLTEPGDVTSLSEKLVLLLENRPLRERLVSWGREQSQLSDVRYRLKDFVEIFSPPTDIGGKGQKGMRNA